MLSPGRINRYKELHGPTNHHRGPQRTTEDTTEDHRGPQRTTEDRHRTTEDHNSQHEGLLVAKKIFFGKKIPKNSNKISKKKMKVLFLLNLRNYAIKQFTGFVQLFMGDSQFSKYTMGIPKDTHIHLSTPKYTTRSVFFKIQYTKKR